MYDDIVLFTKIVKFAGYSAAAKQIGMLQPLLSRRMKRLEQQLGAILIKRNTKIFSLTEIGQELYDQFKNDETLIQTNIEHITQIAKQPSGQINVSLPLNFSFAVVTPYLSDFIKLYPNISLNITYHSEEINLEKNNLDFAISLTKLQAPNQITKLIGKSKIILYVSPKYLINHRLPKTLKDLAKHDILGLSGESWLSLKNNTAFDLRSKKSINFTIPMSQQITTNNMAHNYVIVLGGYFIGIGIETFLKPLFDNGEVMPVLPSYRFGDLCEFYALLPSHGLKPSAKVFLDFIRFSIIRRSNRHFKILNLP